MEEIKNFAILLNSQEELDACIKWAENNGYTEYSCYNTFKDQSPCYFITNYNNNWYCLNTAASKPIKTLSEVDIILPKKEEKSYKYEVVHCKTQEEWNFVTKKLNKNWYAGNDWTIYKETSAIELNRTCFGDITQDPYNKNTKIYSFEEWCDKFGYKPDFINKSNEIPQENNNSIPEYVEYIDTKYKGQIVKVEDWTSNTWCKVVFSHGQKEQPFKHLVKSSTKEAYKAQFQQNSISNNDIIEVGDIAYYEKPEQKYLILADNGKSTRIRWLFDDIMGYKKGSEIDYSFSLTAINSMPEWKLYQKASQTTNYIHEKQVDSVSPQVNTDLILIKKAKKTKEIDILPVQSPIFVNQKVNNKKQLLILN